MLINIIGTTKMNTLILFNLLEVEEEEQIILYTSEFKEAMDRILSCRMKGVFFKLLSLQFI